jgi:hypothetical protein
MNSTGLLAFPLRRNEQQEDILENFNLFTANLAIVVKIACLVKL